MRFPSFPFNSQEKASKEPVKKQETSLAQEEGREKIKNLQGSLRSNEPMTMETRNQQIKDLITLLEEQEIAENGELPPVEIEPLYKNTGLKESDLWADTINLQDSAANESDLGEDRKLA
jgi:hypothetical protein